MTRADKAVKLQCGQSSPRKAFINHNSKTNLAYLMTNPNLEWQIVDFTAQPKNGEKLNGGLCLCPFAKHIQTWTCLKRSFLWRKVLETALLVIH